MGLFSIPIKSFKFFVGDKQFNKIRGRAISIHTQIIKSTSKSLGIPKNQQGGIIKLAKTNGHYLGFLE